MSLFGTYTPPAAGEGDQFKPSENKNKPLIIKVYEHKTGIVTQYKPQGGDGVIIDVLDLSTGALSANVLWMNGALVDGLKAYVGGQPIVVRLAEKQGKTNAYIVLEPGSAADITLAEQFIRTKGDPFVKLSAPAAAPVAQAPVESPAEDIPAWAKSA